LQVVEHQSERLAAREELPEKLAREGCYIAAAPCREDGQIAGAGLAEPLQSVRKIVEERRRIRVVRIDLIPDRLQLSGLDVACGEVGLARSWRPRDPYNGARGRLI